MESEGQLRKAEAEIVNKTERREARGECEDRPKHWSVEASELINDSGSGCAIGEDRVEGDGGESEGKVMYFMLSQWERHGRRLL